MKRYYLLQLCYPLLYWPSQLIHSITLISRVIRFPASSVCEPQMQTQQIQQQGYVETTDANAARSQQPKSDRS